MKKSLIFYIVILILFNCKNESIDQSLLNFATGLNTGVEATEIENTRLENIITDDSTVTNLNILVTNTLNQVVENASIEIDGNAYTTDTKGFLVIENVTLNKDYAVIRINSESYTETIKTITPSQNGITNVNIVLSNSPDTQTFNSAQNSQLIFDDVTLEFPADAIANQDGSLFNGDVTVSLTYYNPDDPFFAQTMPATLVGLTNEELLRPLVSKGMVKVDLFDALGNELEILTGEQVDIIMPAKENDPLTIDIWHLNENYGIWVESSFAVKQGDVYVAKVSHFSTYNLDIDMDGIEITIEAKTIDNVPLSNQDLNLLIGTASGLYEAYLRTDNLGRLTLLNAPEGDYNLFYTQCNDELIQAALGNISNSGNYTATFELPAEERGINFSGTLYGCDNEVWANKAFAFYIENGNDYDYVVTYTNAVGVYDTTQFLCDYDFTSTYNIEFYIYNENQELITQQETFIFNSGTQTNDITVCLNSIIFNEGNVFNGDVFINNLTDYDAFISGGYTEVTGFLDIADVPSLVNIDELSTLTTVGDYMLIRNHPDLINLDGLENINFVGGNGLDIIGNTVLTDLCGLQNYANMADNSISIDSNAYNPTVADIIAGNCSDNTSATGIELTTGFFASASDTSCGSTTTADLPIDITYLVNGNTVDTNSYTVANASNNELINDTYVYNETSGLIQIIISLSDYDEANANSGTGQLLQSFNFAYTDLATGNTIGGDDGFEPVSLCDDGVNSIYQILYTFDLDINQGSVQYLFTDYIVSTVYTGDVFINNLTDYDAFISGGYTEVTGFIDIADVSGLTNIDELSTLTTVGDYMLIRNQPDLVNLNGLENINFVGGNGLGITSNTVLTDLCGLQNYANTANSIIGINNNAYNPTTADIIAGNCSDNTSTTVYTGDVFINNLTDYDAFISGGYTEVTGFIDIADVSGLTNIDELSTLTTVGDYFEIRNQPDLVNLNGLENINFVGGNGLGITSNTVLTDLCGLQNYANTASSIIGINNNAYNPTAADIIAGNCAFDPGIEVNITGYADSAFASCTNLANTDMQVDFKFYVDNVLVSDPTIVNVAAMSQPDLNELFTFPESSGELKVQITLLDFDASDVNAASGQYVIPYLVFTDLVTGNTIHNSVNVNDNLDLYHCSDDGFANGNYQVNYTYNVDTNQGNATFLTTD